MNSPASGVDVVEVVVVVVVVVGVVRRHLLDAGGDAPHRLHVRLRSAPPPAPLPSTTLPPGLPCPVLPVPWGPWHPCLCPWAPFGPPARAVGPAPCHPRPGLPARPQSLAPLPAPGRPARAPARPSRALAPSRPPALSHAVRCPRSVPSPLLRPCSLPRVPWPARCACSWALPLSPPVPRSALPWLARSSACAPSPLSWITRRASCCLCSCGSAMPGGERSGAGGRTCRVRPGGKGLGGKGFGGLVWVWMGLAWARYYAPSLPTAAAAAAAGEAPVARAGSFPCFHGVLGAAAWQHLARPSRSPLQLRQPLAMRPVPAPGLPPVSAACRGPRSGPRRGSLGLRSPLPARLGFRPGAGRQGLLLGRGGRSPRPAQAPGSTAWCQQRPPGAAQLAARPAPPPPPASAPRAPRRSLPSTPGRRGGESGTGGGGGRPAGGSHLSLPSLLSW